MKEVRNFNPCVNCKSKKKKCSNGNPCERCSKANVECIYPPVRDINSTVKLKNSVPNTSRLYIKNFINNENSPPSDTPTTFFHLDSMFPLLISQVEIAIKQDKPFVLKEVNRQEKLQNLAEVLNLYTESENTLNDKENRTLTTTPVLFHNTSFNLTNKSKIFKFDYSAPRLVKHKNSPSSIADFNNIMNMFNFSGVFNDPICDPISSHSFIKEIDSEEAIQVYMPTEGIIQPSQNLNNALNLLLTKKYYTQIKNLSKVDDVVLVLAAMFYISRIRCPSYIFLLTPDSDNKYKGSPPKGQPRLPNETMRQYLRRTSYDLSQLIHILNYMFHHDSFRFYFWLAYGCQSSNHPLLYETFGGPNVAALNFSEIGYSLMINIDKNLDIYIEGMLDYCHLQFSYGNRIKAIEAYDKLEMLGVLSDYDSPNGVNCLEFAKNPAMVYKKRILWVKFFCFSTFVKFPLIGDELQNMDLTLESEWEKFFVLESVPKFVDIGSFFTITDFSRICFLTRKIIRFANTKNLFGDKDYLLENTVSLHNELIGWFENLSKNSRIFQSLADYILGFKLAAPMHSREFYDVSSKSRLLIWFLYGIIKIHSIQRKNFPSYQFPFEKGGKLKGTSMEFILCGIRALSSILANLPPEHYLRKVEDTKRFVFHLDNIIYMTPILEEVIVISLECIEDNIEWASVFGIQEEVLNFHIQDFFIKILRGFNTPYALETFYRVEKKIKDILYQRALKNNYLI
ncbi:hypothetical protein HDU92_006469 [Lobulomyces angularis]|nr:hypothetical protein HDU92_006469 [Lobulomyces angularis]